MNWTVHKSALPLGRLGILGDAGALTQARSGWRIEVLLGDGQHMTVAGIDQKDDEPKRAFDFRSDGRMVERDLKHAPIWRAFAKVF